jgi:hypothetical protein
VCVHVCVCVCICLCVCVCVCVCARAHCYRGVTVMIQWCYSDVTVAMMYSAHGTMISAKQRQIHGISTCVRVCVFVCVCVCVCVYVCVCVCVCLYS